jgi:mono/diheme cytochrome c family protein
LWNVGGGAVDAEAPGGIVMDFRTVIAFGALGSLGAGLAFAGAITSEPDPARGKDLAARLCSNCHLVGTNQQEHANVDVPSFREIANKSGQTEGSIMANILLPKHPMPTIPLTKREVGDLAAYIMGLRDPQEPSAR